MEYEIHIDSRKLAVDITADKITVDGQEIQAEIIEKNGAYFIHQKKNISTARILSEDGNTLKLQINGKTQEVVVHDHISILLEKLGMSEVLADKEAEIKAPMPGSILEIMVNEGDEVEEGQAILILEAMKMENMIKAPSAATIKKVNIAKGDNVEKNATLIEFE